ncbi:MAG TPA: hypothetical protein VM753_18130 [Anaeromyxobacter sp.]|nr:hypothetical protein [Anaeromyxobacter sp.]
MRRARRGRTVDDVAAWDTRRFVRRWVARTVLAAVVAPGNGVALAAELRRVGIRATELDRVDALRGGPLGAVVLAGALGGTPTAALPAALAAAERVLDEGALLLVLDAADPRLERAVAARFDVLEVRPLAWRWRLQLPRLRQAGTAGVAEAVRLLRQERAAVRAGGPAAGVGLVAARR